MKYTQIKVTCLSRELDRVSAVMSAIDPALMIEDYSDIEDMDTCYGELIDESLLNADREHAWVSLFLTEDKSAADTVAFLRERFTAEGLETAISVDGVDEADWENEWRKYYHPVHIGDRITVVPAWQEYDAREDEVTVKMDPGLAFGTGTHETTRLCATLLEKYMSEGDTVLDVGTGSGILAIIARKLGAGETAGTDIDPVAVRVAKENATDNGEEINFFVSDLLAAVKDEYDIVVANIVADIIIRMAPDVKRVMAPTAKLIVSGVIADREEEVTDSLVANGLRLTERLCENDWRGMVFER